MTSPMPAESSKRKRSGEDEGSMKARKPPNLVGPQTIVTVNIKVPEKEVQPFRVHKNYICYYSPFFEAAFNGSFVEGETQVMEMDETTPEVFGIFVNWLYTQTVVDAEGQIPSANNCISLWILGDRVLAPGLQNSALAALEQRRISSPSPSGVTFNSGTFHYVWKKTTEGSPLRLYLVDVMVESSSAPLATPNQYPRQMLFAMVNELLQNRERNRVNSWGGPVSNLQELETYFVPEEKER